MSLNLDETVALLTDQNASIYLRAIRLFEFQACLYYPRAFSSARNIRPQVNARLFAAFGLLGHIQRDLALGKKAPLRELALNTDYAQIFDEVITKSGGWRR